MPFTPLHFGPGLIVKAAVPGQFSLTAYTLANIAVDLEPLCHIVRRDYPLHGPFHTLPLATLTENTPTLFAPSSAFPQASSEAYSAAFPTH
jgi:hypothetical protein